MKKITTLLLVTSLLMASILVSAEDFSIEQTVPFGIVTETTDLYITASKKSSIGKVSPGLICQIISIMHLGGEQWYKIRCFSGNSEVTGCIISRYIRQMTVSELIAEMSDPSTAAYMQNFLGLMMFADADTESPGERSGYSFGQTEETPKPTIIPTPTAMAKKLTYVLNTSTKKFHYPNCSSVKEMATKNKKEYIGTREEIIKMGYSPCGNCHP